MKFAHKPASLAIIVPVIAASTAGSAYAAIKWLQPHTILEKNSITHLPNGDIRFWVHSDSCQGQEEDGPVDSYYEIKAGSKITPQQLATAIEAECEADLLPQLFPQFVPQTKKVINNFHPGDKQYFIPYAKILGVGTHSITTQSGLNGNAYPPISLPVDKNARFYFKGKPIRLGDIKPGDWVTMVSYTTALSQRYSTETDTPQEIEKLSKDGFPIGARVAGLIKHAYNPETTMEASGAMGEDWTRLVRDKNSPDGWRQLVPFDHNFHQ